MEVELTKEETENLILVEMDYLQKNTIYPENCIGLKFLAINVNMELDAVRKFVQELELKKAVQRCSDQTESEEYNINLTEYTLKNFEKLNALTINETAMLLLEKTYSIYKRAGYDGMFQFDSAMIGRILGLTNTTKIVSAIEMLENKGMIKNTTVMMGNIIYFIAARGIDMVERGPEKQKVGSNIIYNKGGNIAINSNHVNQSTNVNDLVEYFATLEKLITENLSGDEKTNALTNLETVQELSKVNPPKKHLIQTVLDNLDKIPILFEIVKKIREYF
jgi:hypothetical protein